MAHYGKQLKALLLALVFAVSGVPEVFAQMSRPESQRKTLTELLASSQAFVKAARAGDAKALGTLLAPEYIGIDPYYPYVIEGKNVVAELQRAWHDYFEPANGHDVVMRRESNPAFQIYGEVAILTYVEIETVKMPGPYARGGRAAKCTFIFRKAGNGWTVIHSHISRQGWPEVPLATSQDPGPEPGVVPEQKLSAELQKVKSEIEARRTMLNTDARKGDTKQWGTLISDDYTEFDPYYSQLLDSREYPDGKAVITEIQRAWDDYDKPPPRKRGNRYQNFRLYGDVGIMTAADVTRGQPLRGGYIAQGKMTSIWAKINGAWTLVHTHDGRYPGADGLPTGYIYK